MHAADSGPSTRRKRGAIAEQMAVDYLCAQGYRVVTRNYTGGGGEIDIIAFEQDVLCFIEVRSVGNTDLGDPLETITRSKIARVVKAAWHYIEKELPAPWPVMRFDAVGIILGTKVSITLVREAFEA